MTEHNITLSSAGLGHLDALVALEEKCFTTDRISRRSMRRFISNDQSIFLVALDGAKTVGYLLILFYRGTRLARLYSIAVDPEQRGKGIAKRMMQKGEQEAVERGAIHFRLEVGQVNKAAIDLYHSLGFQDFGLWGDYYEDHTDALRMQKRIRYPDHNSVHVDIPWIQQNTPFTCGPAALLMAMAGINPSFKPGLSEELQIWRETTTIFMTSGHGGCHPLGLALAARRRGFKAEVWINKRGPLFVEGVRSEEKKKIITTVHADFLKQSKEAGIVLNNRAFDLKTLREACDSGAVSIVLISTYRLDWKKAPHWVVVTGYDERCFYVHDPDYDEKDDTPRDLQHIPIANEVFGSMASYGSTRLRCAVILSNPG